VGFSAAGIGAVLGLGLGFWGPAVFLLAVTLSFSDASVTGWGEGFRLRGEVVVALTTRPLGRRNSTNRPSPYARQKTRSAGL
jgi:hypothetical protein